MDAEVNTDLRTQKQQLFHLGTLPGLQMSHVPDRF